MTSEEFLKYRRAHKKWNVDKRIKHMAEIINRNGECLRNCSWCTPTMNNYCTNPFGNKAQQRVIIAKKYLAKQSPDRVLEVLM